MRASLPLSTAILPSVMMVSGSLSTAAPYVPIFSAIVMASPSEASFSGWMP
jgi:hypothetical protein